ncbi:MAG: Gfo/Idh/MocA family oxidoreductase [Acholeplasmataceae bacterium]
MNPYRVAIIGLGQIASKYKRALDTIDRYKLVAVCDLNTNAISRDIYSQYPFYADYMLLIEREYIDFVIISTPPKTHKEIAMNVLQKNVNVFLEKPGVLDLNDMFMLFETAQKNNLFIQTMFHWQHTNELYFVKQNYPDLHKASSIKSIIYDPYMNSSKQINPEKISLNGAWFDSGVNVLSMLSSLINLKTFREIKKTQFKDENSNLPYYAHHTYKSSNQSLSIIVNWRYQRRDKQTLIKLDNKVIKIIHHLEEVYENNKLVYKSYEKDRLSSHYYNFFKQLDIKQLSDTEFELIHRLLIKGGAV